MISPARRQGQERDGLQARGGNHESSRGGEGGHDRPWEPRAGHVEADLHGLRERLRGASLARARGCVQASSARATPSRGRGHNRWDEDRLG